MKSQQKTKFQGKFGLVSDLGLGNSYVFAGVPFRSIPFDSIQRGDFSQFGHSCPVNPKKEKNLLSGPALSRNPENGHKFWLLAQFLQLSAIPGRHRKFGAELKRIRPERLTQSQLDKGRWPQCSAAEFFFSVLAPCSSPGICQKFRVWRTLPDRDVCVWGKKSKFLERWKLTISQYFCRARIAMLPV